jgi:hypothetical protein
VRKAWGIPEVNRRKKAACKSSLNVWSDAYLLLSIASYSGFRYIRVG